MQDSVRDAFMVALKSLGYSMNYLLVLPRNQSIRLSLPQESRIPGCNPAPDLEELLRYVVDITILLFEIVGVFVIIISGVKGIIDYIKHNPSIRLNLATGMASSDYGAMFAMATISIMPAVIMFICLQKYLVEGISTSGLKG